MIEDVLTAAIAQRKQLAEQMKQLDSFISMYRRLQSGEAQIVGYPPTVTIRADPPKSIELGSLDILREAGETVPTKEILQRLSDRDIHVGGKDPVNNLASVLSRSNAIENIRGKGWILGELNVVTDVSGRTSAKQSETVETKDAPPESTDEASNSEGLAGSPGGALQSPPGRFESD